MRRNVNALSGAILVESRRGHGTTFTIRLPLTLAIIDGFAVKVGTETYVIPLSSVQECLELPSEKHTSGEGGVINLRGEALPYVRLRDLFECGGKRPAREKIIVVEYHGGRAGLAADELLGEQQAVSRNSWCLRLNNSRQWARRADSRRPCSLSRSGPPER